MLNENVEKLITLAINFAEGADILIEAKEYVDEGYQYIISAVEKQKSLLNGKPWGFSREVLTEYLKERLVPIQRAAITSIYNRCHMKTGIYRQISDAPMLLHSLKSAHRKVKKAMANIQALKNGRDTNKIHRQVGLVCLSDIEPKAIKWLWQDRIPLGKLTVVAGESGLSKSTLAFDLAARVTRGSELPFATAPCPQGSVIIVSGEDDPNDTIRPRLDVMGADTDQVFMLDIRDQGKKRFFQLSDVDDIRVALAQLDNPKLIVIDPVSSFVGKADSNKNSDVRALLTPLSELAAEHEIAILLVTHLNKAGKTATNFRNRIMGSAGWLDAARSGFLVTEDQSDPTARILSHAKSNLSARDKSICYRIIQVPHPVAGKAIKIEWAGEVDITADEALEQAGAGEAAKLKEASDFLKEVLANGAMPADEIKAQAESRGIKDNALWRAKEKLSIKAEKRGFKSGWEWRLPTLAPVRSPSSGHISMSSQNEEAPF